MTRPKQQTPIVVTPVSISQMTCEVVCGVDPRRYLETIVPLCRHVGHVGRLRVAKVDEVLRVLATLAPEKEEVTETAPAPREPAADGALDFDSPDDFLRALGRRRASL